MKKVIAAAVIFLAATAQADTFSFSYSFDTDIWNGFQTSTVTGSFSGIAAGDLVTNLSDISVEFNGVPFSGSGNLSSDRLVIQPSNTHWEVGGGVASFSGLNNNFFFADGGVSAPNTNQFLIVPRFEMTGHAAAGFASGLVVYSYNGFDPKKWQLTNTTVSAVPEPETYAMMLAGLGLIGTVARRRKQNSLSA